MRLYLLLAAMFSSLCAACSEREPLSYHHPPAGSQAITLRGTTFNVPSDRVVLVDRGRTVSFSIEALWPDMEARSLSNWDEMHRHGGAGLFIIVTGESSENPALDARTSLTTMLNLKRRSFVGPSQPTPTSFGLAEDRAIGFRPGYSDNLGRFDYFAPPNGSASIFCQSSLSREDRFPEQSTPCEQHWIYRNLNVEVHYYRWLLPRWRDVQTRTDALLDTLATAPH
jgi:hypothetical protein